VLHDVRVIAIDQHLDNKDGQAVVARNVTFEVTPKQSEIIAVASEIGKLSLSLRSLAAVKGQKSAVVATADSHDDSGLRNVTLDSEVSQVLFTSKQNPNDGMVIYCAGMAITLHLSRRNPRPEVPDVSVASLRRRFSADVAVARCPGFRRPVERGAASTGTETARMPGWSTAARKPRSPGTTILVLMMGSPAAMGSRATAPTSDVAGPVPATT
jgi:Flp pilus assembly protein RcpC/CpaB